MESRWSGGQAGGGEGRPSTDCGAATLPHAGPPPHPCAHRVGLTAGLRWQAALYGHFEVGGESVCGGGALWGEGEGRQRHRPALPPPLPVVSPCRLPQAHPHPSRRHRYGSRLRQTLWAEAEPRVRPTQGMLEGCLRDAGRMLGVRRSKRQVRTVPFVRAPVSPPWGGEAVFSSCAWQWHQN